MQDRKNYNLLDDISNTMKSIEEKSKNFDGEKHLYWAILCLHIKKIHNIRENSYEYTKLKSILNKINALCSNDTPANDILDLANEVIGIVICCMNTSNLNLIEESLNSANKKIDDFISEKKDLINDKIDKLIEKSPISSFSTESSGCKVAAWWWLGASGLIVILMFIGFIYLYNNQAIIDDSKEKIALYLFMLDVSKKIIFTAVMLFFFGICIKQFKINRHLYTINKTKEHAYQTYINMIATAKNDENLVSLKQEISKCIFTIQPSGYLGGDDGDMKALEILKYIDIKQKQ